MFQEVEFLDKWHIKAVFLSALSTGRIYSHARSLVLISVRGCVDFRDMVGTVKSIKKSSNPNYNRTRPVAQYLNPLRHYVA